MNGQQKQAIRGRARIKLPWNFRNVLNKHVAGPTTHRRLIHWCGRFGTVVIHQLDERLGIRLKKTHLAFYIALLVAIDVQG